MADRHCPECGEVISVRARKCSCGWQAEKKQEPSRDNRCSWLSNGMQCRYIGTWSDSTVGTGKWYCREHSYHREQEDAAAVVNRSMREVPDNFDYSTSALVKRARQHYLDSMPVLTGSGHLGIHDVVEAMKKPRNPRAWAHKILDRVGQGEHVPIYAIECAKEAATGWKMREPGQEG